jgi:hypothetical protein
MFPAQAEIIVQLCLRKLEFRALPVRQRHIFEFDEQRQRFGVDYRGSPAVEGGSFGGHRLRPRRAARMEVQRLPI